MTMQTGLTTDPQRGEHGFSLLESVVTIMVIGVLAALALGSYHNVLPSSRAVVAKEIVATLNSAVLKYGQLHGNDIQRIAGDPNSADEELAILRALQWNSAIDPDPAAPYFRNDYNPSTSSKSEDYRIVWNGHFFELRQPEEAGDGLLINFDSSDVGQPVQFPNGFVPLSGL